MALLQHSRHGMQAFSTTIARRAMVAARPVRAGAQQKMLAAANRICWEKSGRSLEGARAQELRAQERCVIRGIRTVEGLHVRDAYLMYRDAVRAHATSNEPKSQGWSPADRWGDCASPMSKNDMAAIVKGSLASLVLAGSSPWLDRSAQTSFQIR